MASGFQLGTQPPEPASASASRTAFRPILAPWGDRRSSNADHSLRGPTAAVPPLCPSGNDQATDRLPRDNRQGLRISPLNLGRVTLLVNGCFAQGLQQTA